ncbi:MAG: VWA domain-containing protein [Bdellovibrionales bacterium]
MIADRFENPAALQFLWAVPVVWGLAWFMTRESSRQMAKALSKKLLPLLTASVSTGRRRLKLVLELAVLALFVTALARPQSGSSKQKVKSEGVEIMMLVDVSQSMMAEDVRPSRLELAKKEMIRFVNASGGNKIGLVAFAGSAVTLSPLTTDKSALNMFLESLSPTAVSSQGTDFRRALSEAKGAFERGGADTGDDSAVTRVILVVSDGEDNESGTSEIIKDLTGQGVRLYGLAIGTERGGAIPMRDERGNLIGNLRDRNGQEVVTKVVDKSLRELSDAGRGRFYHLVFGGDTVRQILADLDRLQKAQFDDAEITSYNEDYQPYLLLALILALIEILLSERRSKGRLWRGRFEVAQS